MEIINCQYEEIEKVKYTPTIKDNSLNWFQIEANKTISQNRTIWAQTLFQNEGVTGVYNTITPLTIDSYVMINQLKQEPILAKLIQTNNGEDRDIMYIIGNRQLKCMQENGTIRDIFLAPIKTYNKKGLCGKKTHNLNNIITTTYIDAHENTRYYWQDYGEFTNKGFRWSIKKLLDEFYIKVDENLEDKYIYTPTSEFPQTNNNTSTQRIIFTRDYNNRWYLRNTFEITNPNNINNILNITSTYNWLFNNNTGTPSARIEMQGICLGYDVKLKFPNNDNICLLRAGKQYSDSYTLDDYIGGYGVITETDGNGIITKKIQGTPLKNKEIEIKKDDIFIIIDVFSLYQLINVITPDISSHVLEYASYTNTINGNTPFVNNRNIYYYLPLLDILTILRIYQYQLNTDITIDESESAIQTNIIPTPTQMRYYPIISYTQKFDNWSSALKAKLNYIKIASNDNNEEAQILDIDLTNANMLESESESNIIELPSVDYFTPPITHTKKIFTRCYEVIISITYDEFKNNLTYISFFGQKARVLSGQFSEDNTAKLIILL